MDYKVKAQQAQLLLDNDVLQMAFDGVLSYHRDNAMKRDVPDEVALESRRMVWAVEEIQAQLADYVTTGKLRDRTQDRGND